MRNKKSNQEIRNRMKTKNGDYHGLRARRKRDSETRVEGK